MICEMKFWFVKMDIQFIKCLWIDRDISLIVWYFFQYRIGFIKLAFLIWSLKLFHHFHQLIVAVYDSIVEDLPHGLLALANGYLQFLFLLYQTLNLLIFLFQLVVFFFHLLVLFLVVGLCFLVCLLVLSFQVFILHLEFFQFPQFFF